MTAYFQIFEPKTMKLVNEYLIEYSNPGELFVHFDTACQTWCDYYINVKHLL